MEPGRRSSRWSASTPWCRRPDCPWPAAPRRRGAGKDGSTHSGCWPTTSPTRRSVGRPSRFTTALRRGKTEEQKAQLHSPCNILYRLFLLKKKKTRDEQPQFFAVSSAGHSTVHVSAD